MRKIPFGMPIIGDAEKNAVSEVLEGNVFVHGPRTTKFENDFAKFTGADYAISVASCTAGLHLSYFYLGLGAGDEVIVPAQTHTATAHAVEYCGATPIFVDAERETGNIDVEQIESRISSNTKAISVVHFLGMPVDMQAINNIANKHNLFVVEDCALAVGSYFQNVHAGLHGDVGCFSFYPVKHMTTAEGGMMITKSPDLAERVKRQRAFGVDRTVSERKVPGVYDVNLLGFNYRMNEIEAALGIEQLKRVPSFLEKREENHKALSRALLECEEIHLFSSSHDDHKSSYYCLSLMLDDSIINKRFEIVANLNEHGIGTSVYYPKAVPCMSYYKNKYSYSEKDFPVASYISNSTISLPVGPHLSVDDMDYIAQTFKNSIIAVR